MQPRPRRQIPAGFQPVPNPWGTAWRREEVVEPGAPPLDCAYVDTETTGLAGGTGTYAFSAAVARPCGDRLQVVQLFLPEPAAEPAFLHQLLEELTGVSIVATYNGLCFDLPLLRSRWVIARLPGELSHPPHLDLLHLTRALLRHRLASCSLREVEARLLGIERDHDLPSSLVPEAYFRYLREGASPTLEAALRHNRQDVVSLHHLHRRLLARIAGQELRMSAADWLAVGRYLDRGGRRADGWRALRCAAELAQPAGSAEAAVLLARTLARRRRAAAAEVLLGSLEARLRLSPLLPVARAKLLEWWLGDPEGALKVVEEAIARLPPGPWHEDLRYRRARLRARALRRRARAASPLLVSLDSRP